MLYIIYFYLSVFVSLYPLNIKVKTKDSIKNVNLNDYLVSVIANEIPKSWDEENFKVMSILARTYVLKKYSSRKKKTYYVRDDVLDQVYAPVKDLKAYNKIYKAVMSTDKYILFYKNTNKIFNSLYHSNCGGKTELETNVWNSDAKNMHESVICKYCKNAPNREWKFKIKKHDFIKLIFEKYKNAFKQSLKIHKYKDVLNDSLNLGIDSYTSTKRVKNIIIKYKNYDFKIDAQSLRRILGFNSLKSTNFTLSELKNFLYFKGKGWGHGVGLCQWGMKNLIKNSFDYKKVIKFYYPNARLKKVNYESL